MALAQEWMEMPGIPDGIKETEGSVKMRIADRLTAGDYRLGISPCFECICEIACGEAGGFETPEELIAHYINRLFAAGAGIAYLDSAMVFPCTGSSIICVDYASLDEEQPLLLAVADTVRLQSRRYGLLREMAGSGRASACILSALSKSAEDSLSFLRATVFSGGQLKHVMRGRDYLDFLAVFDALSCRLLLDSKIEEEAEPELNSYRAYLSDRKAFGQLCREFLMLRGKVVKVNGKPNVKMYALMDYVQYMYDAFLVV